MTLTLGAAFTSGASSNTYFFKQGDGADTINFGTSLIGTSTYALTIAVDRAYGNVTTGYINTSSTATTSSLITFGSASSGNSIFINGISGTSANDYGTLGITFVTISASAITELG